MKKKIPELTPKDFEDKVRSMSAKEIILSMCVAPEDRVTETNMKSFGHVKDDLCFGCMATESICNIMGFDSSNLVQLNVYEGFGSTLIGGCFIRDFEYAIDCLRRNFLSSCNEFFNELELPEIKDNGEKRTSLQNSYTKEDLIPYIELANFQEQ